MVREFIGATSIRNQRDIYKVPGGYEVDHIDGKKVTHVNPIPDSAVEILYKLCVGETVTSDEAAFRLRPHAEELNLIYKYGWKLKFHVQEIMLILEVLGKLEKWRKGNRYFYRFVER